MLKLLHLHNLILVEEALVEFEKGLTVITGETGSGKTALIEALRLVMGERADTSKIRKGCEKARVMASFEPSSTIKPLLDEAGIEFDESQELIIKREIAANGKSRAFVNGQLVPIGFLQTLKTVLVDFIGQHAQILLKHKEEQLILLDQFAQVDSTVFQKRWAEEKSIEKTLKHLVEKKQKADERLAQIEAQLEELEEANVQDGEEATLFEEYSLLANAQELLNYASSTTEALDSAIAQSALAEKQLTKMMQFDKSLEEVEKLCKEALFLLQETLLQVQSFVGKIEEDPNRLSILDERLRQINHLQKKYGKNLHDYLKSLIDERNALEDLDVSIANAKQALEKIRALTNQESERLTSNRLHAAERLKHRLSEMLHQLNMKQARVDIVLERGTRSATGDDSVTFFLQANQGEQSVPVHDGPSGGELSRLLFSLKVLLAGQTQPQTLVFDEIDANVGGETASIMGNYLKQISLERQIICITHFPQVAKQGNHHIGVYKLEEHGRTLTKIQYLNREEKEEELLRMLGGKEHAAQFSLSDS